MIMDYEGLWWVGVRADKTRAWLLVFFLLVFVYLGGCRMVLQGTNICMKVYSPGVSGRWLILCIHFKRMGVCERCFCLWMSVSKCVCSNDFYQNEGWPGCNSNIDHLINREFDFRTEMSRNVDIN